MSEVVNKCGVLHDRNPASFITILPSDVMFFALKCNASTGMLQEVFSEKHKEKIVIDIHSKTDLNIHKQWTSFEKCIALEVPDPYVYKKSLRKSMSRNALSSAQPTLQHEENTTIFPFLGLKRAQTTLQSVPVACLTPQTQFSRRGTLRSTSIIASGQNHVTLHLSLSDGDRLLVICIDSSEILSQRHLLFERICCVEYDRYKECLWYTVYGRNRVVRLEYPEVDQEDQENLKSFDVELCRQPEQLQAGRKLLVVLCSLERKLFALDKSLLPAKCVPLFVIPKVSQPCGFGITTNDDIFVRQQGGILVCFNNIGQQLFQINVPFLCLNADDRINFYKDSYSGQLLVWEHAFSRKVIYSIDVLMQRLKDRDITKKRVNSQRLLWRSVPLSRLPKQK